MSGTTEPGLGTPRFHRSRKASHVRFGNAEAAAEADRDLRAAVLAKAIETAVEQEPPLTDTQRLTLVCLLVGSTR